MSFSFSKGDTGLDEAIVAVATDTQMPMSVKAYLIEGIQAIRKRHGPEAKINLSASGHLHNGEEGNWDSTTAQINVHLASAE